MNDDDFDDIVGSERDGLFNVEFLKTINFRQARALEARYGLSAEDKRLFWKIYFNEAHEGKSIRQIIEEAGGIDYMTVPPLCD